MWVPKTPRRSDFCGMPPCPLCYDYVGGDEVKTDGKVKMAQDMLGRTPTKTEQKVIDESAEKIHLGNLSQKQVDEADLVEAEIKDMTQNIERTLAFKRKAHSIPKRQPRQKTLDEIDIEAIEKREQQQRLQQLEAEMRKKMYDSMYGSGFVVQRAIPSPPAMEPEKITLGANKSGTFWRRG